MPPVWGRIQIWGRARERVFLLMWDNRVHRALYIKLHAAGSISRDVVLTAALRVFTTMLRSTTNSPHIKTQSYPMHELIGQWHVCCAVKNICSRAQERSSSCWITTIQFGNDPRPERMYRCALTVCSAVLILPFDSIQTVIFSVRI